MPSSRWARRSRSARCSASAPLGVVGAHLDPAVAERTAARPRVSGTRRAPRRRSRRAGDRGRRPARGARAGARPEAAGRAGARPRRPGAPSRCGNSVGKSRMPRTSAPRKRVDRLVRVADHDEVAAVAGERRSSATWPGSVSWYSSTKTCANWRAQLVAVGGGLDRRRGGSGRRSRSRSAGRGSSRYCSRNSPAAANSGKAVLDAEARAGLGVQTLLPGPAEHGLHLAGEPAGAERAPQGLGPPHRLGASLSSSRSTHVLLRGARAAAAAPA